MMLKTQMIVIVSVCMMLTGTFLTVTGAQETTEPISWVFQAWDREGGFVYAPLAELAEKIKLTTNGQVRITVYPVGTYAATMEMLDAVKLGIIDGACIPATLYHDQEPALAAESELAAAYTEPWQKLAWLYYKGGMDMVNDIFMRLGVVSIGVLQTGVESIASTKPLRGLDDLKGLKLRLPVGITTMLFEKLGANPIMLAPEDVRKGLELGVVEAADQGPIAQNISLGAYDVKGVEHTNFPGFHSMPSLDIIVNQQQWEALPANLQQIILLTTREWTWDVLYRREVENFQALEEVKAKGVTIYEWSPDDVNTVRAVAVEVWDEWAQKSPLAKKVIESQKAWLQELGLIE